MHTNAYFIIIITVALIVLLAIPLGKYIAQVFTSGKWSFDKVFNPIEKTIFKLGGIDTSIEMNWKLQLKALLWMNLIWFLIALFVLMNMSWLPLNPDANPSMSLDLAFNTAVSFITNTNLQHYSGETAMSYLGQMTLMLWQFISAGCGIAIAIYVFKLMSQQHEKISSNFYVLFVKANLRILLPLSIIVASILVFSGTPMTFNGKDVVASLEGEEMHVSRGPVAAFVAIKQLGTNGGGFFGPNSSHPFENPSLLTNVVENVCILLIPIALIIAFGQLTGRKKHATMIFMTMMVGFIMLLLPAISAEMSGNPLIGQMNIDQQYGNMEGKEVRFGSGPSALWAVSTTCTSNGSVNAMHDSMMPITGLVTLTGMMINGFFGGVGVGFLNFYVFIILAVFVSGLMVGRTPEFLGKKIEPREMKIAVLITLLHPFLILTGSALASYIYMNHPDQTSGWLNNSGYHGYTEMLYEFTSSSANNGSGFEGLGDNTPFWNYACGIVMLLARYLPIIGPVMIAGLLASKKSIPEGPGTLKTDTPTFSVMVFLIIMIVSALSFFPALTLGPIAEHFSIY